MARASTSAGNAYRSTRTSQSSRCTSNVNDLNLSLTFSEAVGEIEEEEEESGAGAAGRGPYLLIAVQRSFRAIK